METLYIYMCDMAYLHIWILVHMDDEISNFMCIVMEYKNIHPMLILVLGIFWILYLIQFWSEKYLHHYFKSMNILSSIN